MTQSPAACIDPSLDFRAVADAAPVLIWVSDSQKQGIWFNRTWLDFTGAPMEEELGDGWLGRICHDDLDAIQECVQAFAEQRPFRTEFRMLRRDGVYRWMIDSGTPRFDRDGVFQGFVGSLVDIEDRKRAEEELRLLNDSLEARVAERTRELAAALEETLSEAEGRLAVEQALRQSQKIQALGQLTGGIAHDFNNLLTPVMGGLELVLNLNKDPALRPLLETAFNSARRGAELTKQLLSFSRIQKLDVKPIRPWQVVDSMGDLLPRSLGPMIRIEFDLKDADQPISADRAQLELAILNLAINARDAMPAGGELTISTNRCTIDNDAELTPGEYVRIAVADTGHGMTPDVAARAFDPFFTTKQVGAGTGLGLSLVYSMARQCGGAARIERTGESGTTIALFLPVTTPGQSELPADGEAAAADRAASATILVVDDDQDVRDFVASTLKRLGHHVLSAPDGNNAIRIMNRQKPDLLITDYAMPGMTGADLAHAAREINTDQKIIYISGYADTAALHGAAQDASVLRKPFGVGDLFTIVDKTLRSGGGPD